MPGCCEDNCNPPIPVDLEPCREPIDCTPPPVCCEHCLLAKFAMLYPQYNCAEGDLHRICLILHQAELLVGGILSGPKREMAILFATLHLLDIQRNNQYRDQAMAQSIAFGEAPNIGTGSDRANFWGLTDWGVMVNELLTTNTRIGFMAI